MYKLITAALGAALLSVPATAQTTDQAKAVRKQFDDCVYRSAYQQLKEARDRGVDSGAVDVDAVTERGFGACKTESTAMASFLRSINVPREGASNLILQIRLYIKGTMRDLIAHPERYVAGGPTANAERRSTIPHRCPSRCSATRRSIIGRTVHYLAESCE